MEKLTIGQMARINNVSIQALRLYDEMNILKPIEVNTKTGYRYYDMKQCAQLDMIQYMKSSGMSLKEIRDVFEHRNIRQIHDILHKHLKHVDDEINRLMMQKRAVQKMIDSYNRYLVAPGDGTITLEYIEERKIYSSKLDINFYDYGLDEYENVLKTLQKDMEEHGINDIYYYNAGTTIDIDDFLNKKYISKDIFVFVDHDCYEPCLMLLPPGMYACMYCDDFDKEKDYIAKLYDYIKEKDMIVTGDYMCEVLSELPMTGSNKREMFLRLQVPVSFVKK